MKKLIIFALAITMTSCSNDDAPTPTPTCNCVKQTWVKPSLAPASQWFFNGDAVFYSNLCSDDGKRVGGSEGNGIMIEYRIKCN